MVPKPRLPSALALIPEKNGCFWWRIGWPFHRLALAGYPTRYIMHDHPNVVEAAADFDLLIQQRISYTDLEQGRELVEHIHRAGKLLILETDDDMWVAREEQKSHAELGVDKPDATPDQHRASTLLYDGVIVSSERLRTVLQSFAPDLPCVVVPNAIDLERWEAERIGWRRNITGHVTVGWFGGDRYDRDVEVLAEAWREIAVRHPAVHFVILGHQAQPLVDAVPAHRLHAIQWLPPNGTPDRPFYGWLYGPYIEHGVDGLVADTKDEWVSALDRLVRSSRARRELRERMLVKVQERYSLAVNLWRWPTAWIEIARAARERASPPRPLVLVPERVVERV
ncbi:MAG: hypothetical protein DYG90_00340 [Chloroflexi bacterium CFX6]|nr:hypothetical protein [Chloroflexi bacterium CFX6]